MAAEVDPSAGMIVSPMDALIHRDEDAERAWGGPIVPSRQLEGIEGGRAADSCGRCVGCSRAGCVCGRERGGAYAATQARGDIEEALASHLEREGCVAVVCGGHADVRHRDACTLHHDRNRVDRRLRVTRRLVVLALGRGAKDGAFHAVEDV